jgi:hypothetical protein
MNVMINKQITLKPQDLLVALKIAVGKGREFTYGQLAGDLFMSTSEVYTSVKRAKVCGLLQKSEEQAVAYHALYEFLIHGVQYVFPSVNGMLTRGMVTGAAGPALASFFALEDGLPQVWPTPEGNSQGIALLPLYPSVPQACEVDSDLYSLLTLVDALRGGKAREREITKKLLKEHF